MRRPRIAVLSAYLRNKVLGEGLDWYSNLCVGCIGRTVLFRTQPCGAVFGVGAGVVVVLTRTVCCLLVRKLWRRWIRP